MMMLTVELIKTKSVCVVVNVGVGTIDVDTYKCKKRGPYYYTTERGKIAVA